LVQEFEEAFICTAKLDFCASLDHVVYAHGHISLHRVARGFEQFIGTVGPANFWYSVGFECHLVLCFLQTSVASWWVHNDSGPLDRYFSDNAKFSQYFSIGSVIVGALHFVV
jgi:hypothetical protein